MPEIAVADALPALDAVLDELSNRPAVFLLWPKQGEPYLAKTAVLRRRLLRLLREREAPSRLLNLRHTIARVEYWLTGSKLESPRRWVASSRMYAIVGSPRIRVSPDQCRCGKGRLWPSCLQHGRGRNSCHRPGTALCRLSSHMTGKLRRSP